MKKYFLSLVFGLFLFGCSEFNDPVSVDNQPSNSKKTETNLTPDIKPLLKTTPLPIKTLSDSVVPPNGGPSKIFLYFESDSVVPPNPKSLMTDSSGSRGK